MKIDINARALVLQSLPKGATGVEVGVHLGDFSAQMLTIAQPKHLSLVDPYKHFPDPAYSSALYGGMAAEGQKTMDARFAGVSKRFGARIEAGQVAMVRKLSTEAFDDFADGSLDFVYLDGDHTLDGVLADIKGFLPKVKVGGLIYGDDYQLGEWWGDGVVKAFARCLHEDPLKIEWVMDNQICCRKIAA